jgi:hypothetical protein
MVIMTHTYLSTIERTAWGTSADTLVVYLTTTDQAPETLCDPVVIDSDGGGVASGVWRLRHRDSRARRAYYASEPEGCSGLSEPDAADYLDGLAGSDEDVDAHYRRQWGWRTVAEG